MLLQGGRSVAKQRVIDVGGGLGPSSSLSLEPRNSMPSQVAEAMGSFRMRSRCLARAEQLLRSRQAHRIKVVTVIVVQCCIIASRVGMMLTLPGRTLRVQEFGKNFSRG